MEGGGVSVRLVGWDGTAVSFMQMPAGMDFTPRALEGLPDDLCQCPHWGYVLEGAVHVRYADGEQETVEAGDVYHWPVGHTVVVRRGHEVRGIQPRGRDERGTGTRPSAKQAANQDSFSC